MPTIQELTAAGATITFGHIDYQGKNLGFMTRSGEAVLKPEYDELVAGMLDAAPSEPEQEPAVKRTRAKAAVEDKAPAPE
jgi:hypothetical protein